VGDPNDTGKSLSLNLCPRTDTLQLLETLDQMLFTHHRAACMEVYGKNKQSIPGATAHQLLVTFSSGPLYIYMDFGTFFYLSDDIAFR